MLTNASKEELMAMGILLWDAVTDNGRISLHLDEMPDSGAGKNANELGDMRRVHEKNVILSGIERYADRVMAEALSLKGSEEFEALSPYAKLERIKRMDHDVANAELIRSLASIPDGQILVLGMINWADSGFPTVTMGQKYCAAMLMTNVTPDIYEYVRRPWRAFFIEVPEGILTVDDPAEKERRNIKRILVTEVQSGLRIIEGVEYPAGPSWAYLTFSDTPISLWRYGVTVEQLLPPRLGENPYESDPTCLEFKDDDARVAALIGRLIVNTCLTMSNPDYVQQIGPGHKRFADSRRRNERTANHRVFQIGSPVKIDFRDRVRQYVLSGKQGRPLEVQSTVAGHYKAQPYGPRNSLRKVVWREPYKRGPADGNIMIRPHELKG